MLCGYVLCYIVFFCLPVYFLWHCKHEMQKTTFLLFKLRCEWIVMPAMYFNVDRVDPKETTFGDLWQKA